MIGQTISHYRIIEQIGAGGMGVVYRARDERLDRDVAIKVLPPGTLADEAARKRFRKEALALAKLNHPNIATVHDFDTQDGIDFLVMEYVRGVTLAEKIVQGGMHAKDVLEIGQQLVNTLADAHEHGIVHRDLKPGNIMLTAKHQVKLLDFGLAKLLNPVLAEDVTRSLSVIDIAAGTLPYMAPEQLRGEDTDVRADIYSVGVILYEIATSHRPFEAKLSTVLADEIIHKVPTPPRHFRAELSSNLETVILRCLEKLPKRRYQSTKELQVDLERLRMSAPLVKAARSIRASKGIDSLAVLPFENASADPEMEYLSDGITETIINSLSQLPKLRIVPRSTVFRYKGREVDPHSLGEDLNVRAVLMGRVVQRGENLTIKTELVDLVNQSQLWGEHYNRKFTDILAIQAEISQEISDKLRLKLTGLEKAKLARQRTADTEAYHAYMKGRYYWNKRMERGGFTKAIQYFNQALEKDPSYALAYTGLSDSYSLADYYGHLPTKEAMPKAKAAAAKAVAIDDTLAEAHTSLGFVKLNFDWDWLGAEKEFKRAIDLDPRYPLSHEWYSLCLLAEKRIAEGLTEMKRAVTLDPLSVMFNAVLGFVFYLSRQYDEAIQQFERAFELDPTFIFGHHWLGLAYEQKGMHKEAIGELRKVVDLLPSYTWPLATLGYVYGASGEKQEAQLVIQKLKEASQRRYVCSYDIALVYTGLGEKGLALEYLEKARDERFMLLVFLQVDPLFDSLRSDSHFQDLVRRIGLPQ
jgi:serine/threonine protein kinase/Tfp pilus assembly protein PilF